MEEHHEVCESYPCECPNGCGDSLWPRSALAEHQLRDCPLHVVSCRFVSDGCGTRMLRSELDGHMRDEVAFHLELVVASKAVWSTTLSVESLPNPCLVFHCFFLLIFFYLQLLQRNYNTLAEFVQSPMRWDKTYMPPMCV